ncbi:MAG TPA: hypothetical protein VJS15_03080, partial [Allosphingosinicella sp.]|nr:hypothetical protein [Allosphingosinicella sp.]
MKHTRNNIRIAIVALSASVVLPIAPVFGQEAPPVINAPPPTITAPPPAAAPPPVATQPAVPAPRI